jgi:hypothetical protein
MDHKEQMTHNSGDKAPTVPPTKTLSLKRPVAQGVVRQSFSHGRSKTAEVVVRVKRRAVSAKVLKAFLPLFVDEKSPFDWLSDEQWQNILAEREALDHREAARQAKRRERLAKPPVDHEDAFWRHYNGCQTPDERKALIKGISKFEFEGGLWTRRTMPMRSNSGKNVMSWNPTYVSESGLVVGEGRGPLNRRNDPKRNWGLPD